MLVEGSPKMEEVLLGYIDVRRSVAMFAVGCRMFLFWSTWIKWNGKVVVCYFGEQPCVREHPSLSHSSCSATQPPATARVPDRMLAPYI